MFKIILSGQIRPKEPITGIQAKRVREFRARALFFPSRPKYFDRHGASYSALRPRATTAQTQTRGRAPCRPPSAAAAEEYRVEVRAPVRAACYSVLLSSSDWRS